jgi:hypothetical protein
MQGCCVQQGEQTEIGSAGPTADGRAHVRPRTARHKMTSQQNKPLQVEPHHADAPPTTDDTIHATQSPPRAQPLETTSDHKHPLESTVPGQVLWRTVRDKYCGKSWQHVHANSGMRHNTTHATGLNDETRRSQKLQPCAHHSTNCRNFANRHA